MRGDWQDGAHTRSVEVVAESERRFRVRVDDVELTLDVEVADGGRLRIATPEGEVVAEVTAAGSRRFVRLGTMDFVFERVAGARRRAAGAALGGLESPMPGVITRVLVGAGDAVTRGQPLIAVEAMKMEHLVRAPRDGRVRAVHARTGELVNGGVPLVELEDVAPAG